MKNTQYTVMVVGGGGREHAIIKALKKSDEIKKIYALPGNGGIAADAECVAIGAKDIDGIVEFACKNSVDYAVVAPDDPLVLGAVDALNKVGIPCFGPEAKAAIIEGSKVFSKNLMKKYNIPTAAFEVFVDMNAALEYLDSAPIPTVIKADGLALGKGVIIAMTREEAKVYPNRNLITRAVGTEADVKTDLFEIPLYKDEYILICTDGLTNCVDEQEILYEVTNVDDTDSCCDRLIDIAMQRGAPDNVSVVLLKI